MVNCIYVLRLWISGPEHELDITVVLLGNQCESLCDTTSVCLKLLVVQQSWISLSLLHGHGWVKSFKPRHISVGMYSYVHVEHKNTEVPFLALSQLLVFLFGVVMMSLSLFSLVLCFPQTSQKHVRLTGELKLSFGVSLCYSDGLVTWPACH